MYRLFFFDGALIFFTPYWSEVEYSRDERPLDDFSKLASSIPSRFFSMDIASTEGGDWLVVELGDGQVTGLPDHADRQGFFEACLNAWRKGDL